MVELCIYEVPPTMSKYVMHFSIDLIFFFQLTEKRNVIQNITRILQSFVSGKLQENKRNTSFVFK